MPSVVFFLGMPKRFPQTHDEKKAKPYALSSHEAFPCDYKAPREVRNQGKFKS